MSYERRKAQAEMWEKVHAAEKIREDRTTRMLLTVVSASILVAAGRGDVSGATALAGQIIDAAHRAAVAAVPGVPEGGVDG